MNSEVIVQYASTNNMVSVMFVPRDTRLSVQFVSKKKKKEKRLSVQFVSTNNEVIVQYASMNNWVSVMFVPTDNRISVPLLEPKTYGASVQFVSINNGGKRNIPLAHTTG